MKKEQIIQKTIRCLIVVMLFTCLAHVAGNAPRQSQQLMYTLGIMVVFGLMLRNIWLALFLWLSVFLYCYYKFQIGNIYINNIFLGCVLYYTIKQVFRREHIDFFLRAFLWLVALNTVYMVLQLMNYDFIYKFMLNTHEGLKGVTNNVDPVGFFGYKGCAGIITAMGMVVLTARGTKLSYLGVLALIYPLYLSQSSICWAAAVVGLAFILFYRLPRRIWIGVTASLMIIGASYVYFVDAPMGMLPTRFSQWKQSLNDSMVHPFTGWGLDSFRNVTKQKQHVYAMNVTKNAEGQVHFDVWDNAHNLPVQLFFEYGILAILILGGYLRQCAIWFRRMIKTPEVLALAGGMAVICITSLAQFPMFLARTAVIAIGFFACFERLAVEH